MGDSKVDYEKMRTVIENLFGGFLTKDQNFIFTSNVMWQTFSSNVHTDISYVLFSCALYSVVVIMMLLLPSVY